MPAEIGIGTWSAWKKKYPFMYRMVQVHEDYGVYVCDQVTVYVWERGEHSWETNLDRHKISTVRYTDGKWMEGRWEGDLKCETR